jgi:DNA-binding FadR family transcriptional regulator
LTSREGEETRRAAMTAGAAPTAITKRKLSEDVAERIQAEVASGGLKPGDRLPSERDLMARYGVGRSAVREALFVLQKSGLVQVRTGERARVTRPTPGFFVDTLAGAARHLLASEGGLRGFQEARLVIEGALARRAALQATAAEVERMAAALEANKRARGDPELARRTDVAFHRAIAEVGGNPIFPAINAAFVGWLVDQRAVSMQVPGAVDLAIGWHERIYRAIAARDAQGALEAMEGHLRVVQDYYWRVVELQEELRRRQERELARLVMPAPE